MFEHPIIFSDIDGTLVDSQHHILPLTRDFLRRLIGQGIVFVPVSARPPEGIRLILDELGLPAPMIAYSGALLLDEAGQILSETGIPGEEADRLWRLIGGQYPALSRSAYCGCDWYTDRPDDPWILQEMQITQTTPLLLPEPDELPAGRVIHKVMCMGDPADIDRLDLQLREGFPRLGIQKSKPTYLEITFHLATKSAGIARFCEARGFSLDTAIAFGDNFNDLDMLEAAGLGIAMGNAPDAIKARADRVTLSNNEEGIYHALRELFPRHR